MRRRALEVIAALAATLLTLAGWAATAARAEFGPIELVSKSAKEQADEARDPAISDDGDFVVFAGKIGGHEGLFRKDLQSGAITLVETATNGEEMRHLRPSISATGRYVAFTSKRALDPEDDPTDGSSDVYVADLAASPPTYELVSAADGSSQAMGGESVAAGRVALSEAGSRVAFMNQGEVYVREPGTTRTILITVKMAGTGAEPVLGGGAVAESEGAAISGDGGTVAWVGRHLPEQVPMLADEAAAVRALEASEPSEERERTFHQYREPLWRRVPSPLEPDPATRRVVGGGDPSAPGCPPAGSLSEPACQGPFPDLLQGRQILLEREGPGWGMNVPQLDRDGDTLAFVGDPEEGSDLFVVDMAPGLSRDQAVRRLTRWVNPVPGESPASNAFNTKFSSRSGPIQECGISPDGNRIAFSTVRQVFPLAPPTLVTPPPPGTSEVAELYQVDLRGESIERVTPGGGAAVSLGEIGGAASPSYSDEGRFLAFASTAYNLVGGDTNDASDAFVVESPPPAPIEPTRISPRPASLVLQPLWRITVSTASLPDGRVRVVVGVPGAGAVRAKATARLGKRLRKHRVAAAHRRAAAPGTQKLILRLSPQQRDLARRKGGLYAQLAIAFEGPGGKPLSAALDARFLVHRLKAGRKR